VTLGAGVLSLVPSEDIPEALKDLRFMLHPLSYALMTFLYLVAAVWDPWSGSRRWPDAAPVVIATVVVLGVALELAQTFTSRGAELTDVLGNVVGVTAAAAFWAGLRRGSSQARVP
jgi:VanZ family protein